MRIGIITDLHEHLEYTAKAIEAMKELGVEEILCLGDFCKMEEELDGICHLLLDHGVKSVWGNHDYGLCNDIQAGRRKDYPESVMKFALTVRPKIEFDSLSFAHVEPWLNPNSLQDLWYYEGEPDTPEKLGRVFGDQSWDIAFAGHYHRWLAFSESSKLDWAGDSELDLGNQRCFVVIDACMHGSCAVFDTTTRILTPINVAAKN